jgi:ribosomal protein S2
MVDIPIPANDDAVKSIKLLVSTLADGIIQGKKFSRD